MFNRSQNDVFIENISNLLTHLLQKNEEHVKLNSELPNISLHDFKSQFKADKLGEWLQIQSFIFFFARLGIFRIENEDVIRVTSRSSYFVIGSLTKFFKNTSGLKIRFSTDAERNFSIGFTKILEELREHSSSILEKDPIHNRSITNVLIKGKQIRNYQVVDVFLFALHPEWDEYHLIGASNKPYPPINVSEEIEDAMKTQLGLSKNLYKIEPTIIPPVKVVDMVSKTTGAFTRYEYTLRVIDSLNVDINEHLKQLLKEKRLDVNGRVVNINTYRWFDQTEIEKCSGRNNEKIMKSTPTLFKDWNIDLIKYITQNAKNFEQEGKILTALGGRFTKKWLIFFLLLVLILVPAPLLLMLNPTDPVLSRYANWATLIQTIIVIVTTIASLIKLLRNS
ncbi:MAG: hypothetical protein KIH69_006030 [Anaerolineae bacterium]|nr:hypothetical protein [Anaerolineae bacterium]